MNYFTFEALAIGSSETLTGVDPLLFDLFIEFTGDNGLLNIARKTGLPFIKIQLNSQINIDQDIYNFNDIIKLYLDDFAWNSG